MKLNITRKKKTESISVENNRVNEIRKETQLDLNLELSDFPLFFDNAVSCLGTTILLLYLFHPCSNANHSHKPSRDGIMEWSYV